ncbi:MAG: hypothetical protein WCK33_09515 [Phycisphaerae bacterium]|jgi:hypothetical protein
MPSLTPTPQPSPVSAADRAIKPPLSGTPVNQLLTSGSWQLAVPGDCGKQTELSIRGGAMVTVKEVSTGPAPHAYDFWAGLHSSMPAGIVAIDRCRLKIGASLLDQGACLEAGWAGIIRSLGGMPPIRTIRISPGRPKLQAAAATFASDPYVMLHLLEPGATADKGVEYLMMRAVAKPVKMALLLLDAKGDTLSTFTLASGSPLRLDRARNTLDPAPPTLEPWARDSLARALAQDARLHP